MICKEGLPDCPAATTVHLIGSKWKLLILRSLLLSPCRFQQLRRELPGLSAKVLTASLRELENDGVVTRRDFGTVPPHVEYALSPLGETLRPVFDALAAWGREFQTTGDQASVTG